MLVNQESVASQADNHILHPGSRNLFRYWETIRQERAAPAREDLDLAAIRGLIPDLFILGSNGLRPGFTWRLAGSHICELYRRPLTGSDALAGWNPFERGVILRFLQGVTQRLQPCVLRFRLTTTSQELAGVEMLGLPMQAAEQGPIRVLGGLFAFRDISAMAYDGIAAMELSGARTIWTEPLPGDALVAGLAGEAASRETKPFREIHGGRK